MTRTRMLLVAAMIAFLAMMNPASVFADDVAPPPVTLDASDVSTVVLAAPIVSLIVSLVIPVLAGLVTKLTTSSGIKNLVMLGLSLLSAVVTNGILADGSAVFTTQTLYTALITWGIAALTYAKLYQPFGITSSAQKDGTPGKLANKGIH